MKKIYILFIALLSVAACRHSGGSDTDHGNEQIHTHETPKGHEAEKENNGTPCHDEIIFTIHQQESAGIKTLIATPAPFSGIIRTTGRIEPAPGGETLITASTDGIVSLALGMVEGAEVGKGREIAFVSTRRTGSGDQVENARIALEIAGKEFRRDSELLKDNIISESHFDQSRLAYENARTRYEALTSGGVSDKGIHVTSPSGGFISGLFVRNGEYVQAGQRIAAVNTSSKSVLRADVPQKYWAYLPQITGAAIRTSSGTFELGDLGGRLISYGKSSTDGFMLPVLFEFDRNAGLVPGLMAEVFLRTSSEEDCISLPLEAVTESYGVKHVFVKVEEDAFVRKEVTLGGSDGSRVRILSGLEEGDEVVVKGAMHIKSAGLSSVPQGHNHSH